MLLHTFFPVAVAFCAMLMDLRTARVDNGWILFSMAVGLLIRVWQEGVGGILSFLAGTAVPLIFPGILFIYHMLGAGDIKLFCSLGGFMGPAVVGKCIFCSFMIGAGISLAILISNGDFRRRFQYFFQYMEDLIRSGERKPYIRKGMSETENFHFTVPVFLSTLLFAGGLY